jgi:hypothetical protein
MRRIFYEFNKKKKNQTNKQEKSLVPVVFLSARLVDVLDLDARSPLLLF